MRRSALLLATMGLALLLASGVALGATRIVTKTFSNTSQIQILDATVEFGPKPADPYPSEINVSGFRRGSVRDANLVLKGYTHTFPEDVGVLLVGPRGQKILVMSDVGGEFFDVFGVNLTLDDEAEFPLPSSTSFMSGTYQPTWGGNAAFGGHEGNRVPGTFPSPAPVGPYSERFLSVFDGTNPNGTWKLYVIDDTPVDTGKFADGWSLVITARVRR